MRVPAVFAACLMAGAAIAQPKLPDLPRLYTLRTVSAQPAAAPDAVLPYGDAPSQIVELFLPQGEPAGPRPVVVLLHGGCWLKVAAGPELMRPAAAAFLEKGYAVWSIGYRRVDEDGGGYPGTYADVGRALDLLRDHAEAHGLDTGRVVLFGHSAGAHLALWAAGRHRLPEASPLKTADPLKPRGVVTVGGFASLKDWPREIAVSCGAGTVERMLAPGEGDDRFADTSPDQLLPSGVPTVLIHGVYDEVAYPAMGLHFARAARAAGDRADLQLAPVTGHFEVIAPGTRAFAQAMAAVETLSPLK